MAEQVPTPAPAPAPDPAEAFDFRNPMQVTACGFGAAPDALEDPQNYVVLMVKGRFDFKARAVLISPADYLVQVAGMLQTLAGAMAASDACMVKPLLVKS